jgi:hypothetical protein
MKKKIMYSILKEIEKTNKKRADIPTAETYGISHEEFKNILKIMIDEKLFESLIPLSEYGRSKNNTKNVIKRAKITMKGINYLEENSDLAKLYKRFKEIRSWL